MKRFTSLLFLAFAAYCLCSCSDDDDRIYVSISGNGYLTVGNNQSDYLYRMVYFSNLDSQEIYLMGNSAYVNTDAQFSGRGAVIKIVMPADTDTDSDSSTSTTSTLQAQSFSIDGDDYTASFSTYVNYLSGENESDFISLDSGTVIIRRSGLYYDIKLLGVDTEGENVIVTYAGYIYRMFVESEDDDVSRN